MINKTSKNLLFYWFSLKLESLNPFLQALEKAIL